MIKDREKKLAEDRALRAGLKRPRDWKEVGWAYVLHALQGGFAGGLAMLAVQENTIPLAVFAFTLTVIYTSYQGLSFARKRDTVGRDMADFSVGWAATALGMWLYYLCFI